MAFLTVSLALPNILRVHDKGPLEMRKQPLFRTSIADMAFQTASFAMPNILRVHDKVPLEMRKQPLFRTSLQRSTNRVCFRASLSEEFSQMDNGDSGIKVNLKSVEHRTLAWVRQHVIGLGLCPFAEGVLKEDSHRVIVSPASTDKDVLKVVASEIQHLIQTAAEDVSTTLVVLPMFSLDDFVMFHDLCLAIEKNVEDDDILVDEVMLAYFHPLHEWADTDDIDDAINFDKRSPYPVINLLRAPQVDTYIAQGRTQDILERNHNTLEKIGNDRIRQLFDGLYLATEAD